MIPEIILMIKTGGDLIMTGIIGSWYEEHIFPLLLKIADGAVIEERKLLLKQCYGQVLEVGIGGGLSAPFYPREVDRVVGIEPNSALLDVCEASVTQAQKESPSLPPFKIEKGDAQALQFEDNRFDTVVAFLVFCTIPDPEQAAKELWRVLKPGGQLLFFEHVLSESHRVARWQKRLNPIWGKIACGCQLNRDTAKTFESVGFDFNEMKKFHLPKAPGILSTVIQGRAIKPV